MKYSEQFTEHIEYAFAAFCKIVLRNAAISAYRDFGRKQKREVSLDYLMSVTPFEPFTTDNYFEEYKKPTIFVAKEQRIVVASKRLADALLSNMALIKCTECGREFSDKAPACPNYGCPTEEMVSSDTSIEKDVLDEKQEIDAILKTVPSKSTSLQETKIKATQKIGALKIDKANQMFQINGVIPTNGKKSGIIGKSFKGLMAVSTLGMSVAAEKMLNMGNKIGSNIWYKFSDLVSYELLEDDAIVTSGGVGQALIGGAVFGGAGAVDVIAHNK